MNTADIHRAVDRLEVWQSLSEPLRLHLIATLLEVGTLEHIPPGRCLQHEGDKESNGGYVLLSGSVRMTSGSRESTNLTAPRLLGEPRRFNLTGHRDATITTAEESTCLRFEWEAFEAKVKVRLDEHAQRQLAELLFDYSWTQ